MARVITLVLEASTYAGSVALLLDGALVADRSVAMRGREHEALMPAVSAVLADAGYTVADVERVICGGGPGSFTSLRIAGGIAKGIALALGVPLVPVSSLALVVASVERREPGRYLAVQDALRGEHYAQAYVVAPDGRIEEAGAVTLVPSAALGEAAAIEGARLTGPGVGGAGESVPRAGSAAHLTNMIDAASPADLASWEPAYGRLAEAQVKWEATHGRPLAAS